MPFVNELGAVWVELGLFSPQAYTVAPQELINAQIDTKNKQNKDPEQRGGHLKKPYDAAVVMGPPYKEVEVLIRVFAPQTRTVASQEMIITETNTKQWQNKIPEQRGGHF